MSEQKLKPSLPWILREHPTLPCYIEAKEFAKAKGMPYALEVFGDDYNGFGDDEQRKVDMEYAVMAAMAHEELIKALQWIVDNPRAHPNNVHAVALAALEGVKENN